MFLPYQKCICCGKKIGLLEWLRIGKEYNKVGKKTCQDIMKENPSISCKDLANLALRKFLEDYHKKVERV